MNYKKFIRTERRIYTDIEVIDLFSSSVSTENIRVLIDHLCDEDLAPNIISFAEIKGKMYFNLGLEELIKITKKE